MEVSDCMTICIPIILAERAQKVALRTAAGELDERLAAEVAIEMARYLVLPVE